MRRDSTTKVNVKIQGHDHAQRTHVAFVFHDNAFSEFLLDKNNDVVKRGCCWVSMVSCDRIDEWG